MDEDPARDGRIDVDLIRRIDELFDPSGIVIVGLPKGLKTGKLFLMALREMGYRGSLYGVNPGADEIDGIPCFPSVSAIADPVDLAIILTPVSALLPAVEECAAKGVKGAVVFTAGGKELGTEEGRTLEARLAGIAKSSGMRILGPNCMGLYAPRTGLSFFPGMSRTPGSVGIISHSGSLANILGRMCERKGICFSKVVSLGNECDLHSADFLAYLGADQETRVIGAYLESIKDGPYFLRALKEASRSKPVLLWKVGLNPEGGRAAASHTGALAVSDRVWRGIVRQGGGVSATGWEEWVDLLMSFALLPSHGLGDRVAIISGPGGLAVSAAEAVGANGLKMARISPTTGRELAEFVPPTGTSLRNPVDVSLTASLDMDIYVQAARAVAKDPEVDAVVMIGIGLSPEANEKYTRGIIEIGREGNKPFLMVNIPGFDPELGRKFCAAGLPFFDSAEKALGAYAKLIQRQKRRENGKGKR